MISLSTRKKLQDDTDQKRSHTDNNTNKPLLDGETEIGVHSKGFSSNSDEDGLKGDDNCNDDEEDRVVTDAMEDINLFVQFTSVEEVEGLHHDKSIEDKGEMP